MKRPRRRESGFALLLVFLMAAIISITLYMEIPRLAFQTQRNKEQLLMERGEQYKLAIRRFMQANKRWPASVDELENLNNRRFLRRRYKDPMTGKDEWRLVHISNGVLTDSKNTKQGDKKTPDAPDNFIAALPGMGSTPLPGQNGANAANRRRASDGGTPGVDPNNPSAGILPPIGPQPGLPGQPGMPGQPPGLTIPPGMPGMPPPNPGVQGGLQNPPAGAYPGMPGAPVNSQNGGGFVGTGGSFVGGGGSVGSQPNNPTGTSPIYAGQQPPYPTAPGSNGNPPGFPNPGNTPGGPQNGQALNMINNILTSPRPGGLAGVQSQAAGGFGGGAGIAGVASNLDADSIMTYADHTNYSEWEFVFNGQFTPPPNPSQGTVGTSVASMGNMSGSSPPGTPIGGQQPGQQGQPGQPGQPGQGTPMGGAAGAGGAQNTSINLRPGRQ